MLGMVAAVMLATSAAAHTALVASTPSEGQTVTELDRVRLEFSGQLLDIGASLTVRGDSESADLVAEFAANNVVEADVPPLASGDYILEWRVVAEDGHPIEGAIAFIMDAPLPVDPIPTADATSPESEISPSPSFVPPADLELNGDFGEKVSQSLSPLDALLIALVGAVLVAIAWLITKRVSARESAGR